MKITTIQLYDETKKKLDEMKESPKESYDSIIRRMIESDKIPSMDEMFKMGDNLKESRRYTTKESIELSHELRRKR